jgi:hypothetical protein
MKRLSFLIYLSIFSLCSFAQFSRDSDVEEGERPEYINGQRVSYYDEETDQIIFEEDEEFDEDGEFDEESDGYSTELVEEDSYEYYEEERDDDELRIDKEYEVIPGDDSNRDLGIDNSYKSKYHGDEFQYSEETKKKEEPVIDNAPKTTNSRPTTDFGGLPRLIMNIFLIIAIGVLVFIIYKVVINFNFTPRSKKIAPATFKTSEEDLEIPEEIDETALNYLLIKAKEDGNFHLAIRYYFLLYLKQLQDLKMVEYHQDKTNADYLVEIEHEQTLIEFTEVSYLYEHVWYGKKDLDHPTFNFLETKFISKIKNI